MRIIGLAGWSGSGKTTLVTSVIPVLVTRGLHGLDRQARAPRVRHRPARQGFLAHRQAGATEVVIVSSRRWAMMHELRDAPEPPLTELLAQLAPVDLVIVEGYKRHRIPSSRSIAPRRQAAPPSRRRLHRRGRHRRAAAAGEVPVLMLDDIETIADVLRPKRCRSITIGPPRSDA